MNVKTYTIIGGVNGTGKSSLTGVLKAESNDLGIIIDVDKLNLQHGSTIAGGKAAVEQIEACIEKGIDFTQETTLSGHKTARTARMAHDRGYLVRLYYVGLDSVEECLKRIKNRVEKGGHNIPSADVRRRFAHRFQDVQAVLPYCNTAVFYDNNNGFAAVAEYKNGELRILSGDPPQWILELCDFLNE